MSNFERAVVPARGPSFKKVGKVWNFTYVADSVTTVGPRPVKGDELEALKKQHPDAWAKANPKKKAK